ncbi:MAG: hypothetical protein R2720_03410 [Candidatus Nanopelagicales bacterium]
MTRRPPGTIEALDLVMQDRRALRALRDAYRRNDPEWLAAADEFTRRIGQHMEQAPGTLHEVRWADIPPWVRLQVLDVWASWHEGTAETCTCWPVPQNLETVVTALWRPGLVACPDCARVLLRARGDKDRTCDLCGHVVAGLDAGEPIYPRTLAYGHMLVSWGECPDCKTVPPGPVRGRRGGRS